MFTGNERLILNGRELPYSMLDFWRVSLSEILFNMNRGSFAEFLVRCALMENGYDALSQYKTGVEAWDIDGPSIIGKDGNRRCRIEVKSTASVQYNTPDSKEPIRLDDTKLTFSIRPAIDWNHEERGKNRNNDLYIFAHYTAEYKASNMLDLRFWDFYVLPTFIIEEDKSLSAQKTISVYRLKKLGLSPACFPDLYAEIMSSIDAISVHGYSSSSGQDA